MKYPTRSTQHREEEDSLDLLKTKLKPHVLFRDQRQLDYGIDVELEWAPGDQVSGRIIKAQVKSSESVRIPKDGQPRVSGIKQSTLALWIQMSRHAPVLVYAVNLGTSEVFISEPIFWQATALLDGGEKTKTIRLRKPVRLDGRENPVSALTILAFAETPIIEVLQAHRSALRKLPAFLEQFGDVHQYDAPMPIHEPGLFGEFLDVCKALIPPLVVHSMDLGRNEKAAPFAPSTWADEWGEISNYAARRPFSLFAPLLIDALITLRARVLRGLWYWGQTDLGHLQLVWDTQLPPKTDAKTLTDWGDHPHHFVPRVTTDVRLVLDGAVPVPPPWLSLHRARRPKTPAKPPRKRPVATRR